MASASSMPPTDQSQDLKRLLECSICLETFDDPRTLPCQHSFCKKCLENFVDGKRDHELNCPVCRGKFTLNEEGVAGMTRNHFICNMVEVLSIQQDKCIPCSHCKQSSVGRCVTCELFMCEKCFKPHNEYPGFQDHLVLTMEELSKPENRSKIKGKSYCKKHPSKKLKLYCETCEELICTYCIVFEHVRRPDHVCSPLEEIAERKREELKTICQTLENNESHSTQQYEWLAATSIFLDRNLEEVKSHIHKRKNSVLECIKNVLEKKAQSLIKETENTARVKNRTIDEELKRISDHKAGQRKAYDIAKALIDNGSNEEIMLSHKSVQQSVEKSEKGYERKEIDDKLPQYSNGQLDKMFHDEIKGIKKGKGTQQNSKEKNNQSQIWGECMWGHRMFNVGTGKLAESSPPQKLVFDPRLGKLVVTSDARRCMDNVVHVSMAEAGCTISQNK